MKQFHLFVGIFCAAALIDDVFGGNKTSTTAKLKIGEGLNIFAINSILDYTFRRYYLLGPTWPIFKDLSYEQSENATITEEIEFCDDLDELSRKYYQNYKIDFLQIESSRSPNHLSPMRYLAPAKYLNHNFSYILVRVSVQKKSGKVQDDSLPQPMHFVSNAISLMGPLNETTFNDFVGFIGTHYIASHSIGDSLFQILVYNRTSTTFEMIKEKRKNGNMSTVELINEFSGPQYVEHLGNILSASTIVGVEDWARENLVRSIGENVTVQSLWSMDDATRSKLSENVGSRATIRLDLKSLDILFGNGTEKQIWFRNMLNRTLSNDSN